MPKQATVETSEREVRAVSCWHSPQLLAVWFQALELCLTSTRSGTSAPQKPSWARLGPWPDPEYVSLSISMRTLSVLCQLRSACPVSSRFAFLRARGAATRGCCNPVSHRGHSGRGRIGRSASTSWEGKCGHCGPDAFKAVLFLVSNVRWQEQ